MNGNYLNYDISNRYQKQNNYYGSPPFPSGNEKLCDSINPSQRDGRISQVAPYYTLGVTACKLCPFYSYLLPYNYPYVETSEMPDPKYYWYYPYYSDTTFYQNPYSNTIQKP